MVSMVYTFFLNYRYRHFFFFFLSFFLQRTLINSVSAA